MSKETKNSIKTVGFEFPTEGNWIYESPDGGQTIYRRKIGEHDSREKIVIEVNPDDFDMKNVEEKAPIIANMMKEVNSPEIQEPSEIDILRQKVLNLEMANSDLKDMLRNMGVAI